MHDAAMGFVTRWAPEVRPAPNDGGAPIIVEIGSANWNGGVRHLFPQDCYYGIDAQPGPGVDLVVDAALWHPGERLGRVDAVIACEVYEHVEHWHVLVLRAWEWLRPEGVLIATMAGPGRKRHAADGSRGGPPPGEWYDNVAPERLSDALWAVGFSRSMVEQVGLDVRCVAWK